MLKLERLQLCGFKSFHDRTEVEFDQGVTAVVGPNGCGKSNILDAMTWVLGEQSIKSLRGSAFEDLIFNGSEKRRPLGLAEVTLRLRSTNGDLPNGQQAVDVTRRLFRSGESEYMLNGTACRLKDVHDLLYGSGLGVKAYSFIEQGKIGAILSARPLDRRALIEEAAGITKFRAKKREAEMKLEAAEQNLVRVRDIVVEVEKQLGSLKRQASRARRYERVRGELRTTLHRLYAGESVELRGHEREALARLSAEVDRRQQVIALVGKSEGEVDELRAAIEKSEDGARGTAERLHETQIEVDRNRNLIVSGRERIEELERRGRELGEAVAAGRAREDDTARAREAKGIEAGAAERREVEARQALDRAGAARAEADAEVAAVEQALDASRAGLIDTVERLATAENALRQRDRAIAGVLARRERLLAAVASAEASVRAAGLGRERERERVAAAEAEVEARGGLVRDALARVADSARRQGELRLAVDERRYALHAREERARSCARIMALAEDAGEPARAAATELGERGRGLVADHVTAAVRFERAVEEALAPLLSALVVSDLAVANDLLAAATAAARGHLRLLLVEGRAPRARPEPLAVEPGIVARLSDLVDAPPEIGAAIAAELEATIVVEGLGDALRLRGRFPGCRLVTLAGEVIGSDGLLVAGSRSEQGLLALRREARELSEDLAVRRADLAVAEGDLAAVTQLAGAAEAGSAAALHALHEAEKDLLGVRHELGRAEEESRKAAALVGDLGVEHEELDLALSEGERERQRECDEQASLGALRARIEGEIDSARHRLEAARTRAVAGASRTAAAESELARAEEVLKAVRAELARIEEAARERAALIAALRDEERQNRERRLALQRETEAAEEALTGLLAEVAALQDRLRGEEEEGRRLRHDLVAQDAALRELRREAELQRERVQAIEIERTRVEGEIERLRERCQEELGQSLEEIEAAPAVVAMASPIDADLEDEPSEAVAGVAEAGPGSGTYAAGSLDELRSAAARLKASLSRLGPVNVLAIEEYQELKSRHDFLTTQANDLTESIESLVQTISRINRTSRDRFQEAFEQINRNFQENFLQLFGGGRAELRLTDEDNLLETGIDIVAQPPGKRLQNILLLSGGEKALAAISLLFALFRYKPSPFCILDEVDAPLDEKNIDRFLGLLRSLAGSTQFILITHSPRTMKVADVLYGVTMEEPGVSRLVSVKLVA